MRLKKTPGPNPHVELFISTAQKYLGYNSEIHGRNMFGQKVGYDSQPWSGAFVDVVAREAFLNIPSFVYSAAGLAECIRAGAISRAPKPGDIAIFNFSSMIGDAAGPFNMPHCGIVTDVQEFKESGRFITVEGNTSGGTKHLMKDGVHQKIRHVTDVVLFCRPAFSKKIDGSRVTFYERLMKIFDAARTRISAAELDEIKKAASAPSVLKLNGEIRHGDRNKRIELIQLALATVTDLRGCEPGKWDVISSAACARFQRNIGRTGSDVTGLPDEGTLNRLSKVTGIFTIDQSSKD
jgi:hypothetical protein